MTDPAENPDLPVVVITGGQGDLGNALAAAFSAGGWRVRAPGRVELDVANGVSVDRYFAEHTRVDLLVNNAGITGDSSVRAMSEQTWDEVMDVNLGGTSRCCKAVLRGMLKRRSGSIVNISSYSGVVGSAGQANYAAAKAGVIGLTKALAKEVGSRGVCVNAVLPGFMETKMTAGLPEKVVSAALAEHALGRFNTVEDAARFVVTLAGMRNVSGQVFQLDSRVTKW